MKTRLPFQKLSIPKKVWIGASLIIGTTAFTLHDMDYEREKACLGLLSSGGITTSHTAAPGETSCHSHHSSNTDNSRTGSLVISVPTLSPGVAVNGTITLTVPTGNISNSEAGFQLVATNGNITTSPNTTQYGTFSNPSTYCKLITSTGRLGHKSTSMASSGGNYSTTWSFSYTAPTGATKVTFYAAAHAGPESGSTTSANYTTSLTITLPVPVKLTQFTATPQNKSTKLNWTAENEINVNHYEAEVSTDGNNFTKLSDIATSVAGGTTKNYSFNDNTNYLSVRTVYYRIKSVDNDGRTEYTNVVTVKKAGTSNGSLSINPTVTFGAINVSYYQTTENNVLLTVTDMSGRNVVSKTQPMHKGLNNVSLDLSAFANGIYYVRIVDGDNYYIKSIVKN